ncbi:MAG: SDR family NAD(P)-dependent oxidoreductase [candidate division Zixibacteria bacterium]|nr:SDR family NAD(P)-dependent oxidoreductase [candidate division Zixibacteria bacterium]
MIPVNSKKVLVTGAGGFIGSHLVETLLKQKAEITALVRYTSSGKAGWLEYLPEKAKKSLHIIYGDIRDPDICRKAVEGNEYIFHLAAQIAIPYSYIAPRDFLTVNALGTSNMLAAARQAKIKKFLHVSTSEVYGSAQYVPIDEKHPQVAQSPYSASKIAADKMVESFHLSFGLPTVTIRPFNCYGPRQSGRAIIPTIILQALHGNVIRLGNITTRRDMNYVTDIVDGMIAACFTKATTGKTVNLATGRDYSIEEIVALVGQIMGKKLSIKSERRRIRPDKSEVLRLQGDNHLARKLFRYKPKFQIKNGLIDTIAFYETNRALYKKEDYQL